MPIHPQELLLFASAALLMVLTPGPNMIYLVSRSLSQGWKSASVSLGGVAAGFLLHMTLAVLGLSVVLLAIPLLYDALKLGGAAYLLWLAWQAVRPGGRSVFQTRELPPDTPGRLFWMGFVTNALNPKIALFYLSIFTGFLHPERGGVLPQSLILGLTQITVSLSVNFAIILLASRVAVWFKQRPLWEQVQRWLTATLLTTFACRLAISRRLLVRQG